MKNVWVYLSDTQRLAKQPEQLRMVLAVTLEQRAPADFLGLAKSLETFYTPFFKCVHELETNKNDLIQKTGEGPKPGSCKYERPSGVIGRYWDVPS